MPSSGWLSGPPPATGLMSVSIRPSRLAGFSAEFSPSSSPVAFYVRSTGRLSRISLNGKSLPFTPGYSAAVLLPAVPGAPNIIEVYSEYSYGPPLIKPVLPRGIKAGWSAISKNGLVPAVPAVDTVSYPAAQKSPSEKLLLSLPWLLPFIIAGMAAAWVQEKGLFPGLRKAFPRFTVGGMAILAVYFLFAKCLAPSELYGFDARGHLEYITHLLNEKVLPRPGDFWQAYQPPLFYILSATIGTVYAAIKGGLSLAALKILPWLSSVANVFLSWLIAREIFGGNSRKAVCAAGVAFLLPVNIYMSAFISNEVFASAVSSLALLLTLRLLAREGVGLRPYFALGIVVGLSLLSKYTFAAFLPVCVGFIAWRQIADGKAVFALARPVLVVLGAVLLAGWFYLRTFSVSGSVFLEQMELFGVWQVPGFRTLSYFTGFGEALRQPFLGASFHSFWDLVYSTLWGDGLVGGMSAVPARYLWDMNHAGAVYLLALPMTFLAFAGWFRFVLAFAYAPSKSEGLARGFAAALLFVAAVLLMHMALRNTSYSTAKAFYVLLVMGPFCAVAAEGVCWFYGLLDRLWVRLLFCGWAGAFAGSVLLAYYLVPPGTF